MSLQLKSSKWSVHTISHQIFQTFQLLKWVWEIYGMQFFIANKHCESLRKEFEGSHKPSLTAEVSGTKEKWQKHILQILY